MYNLREIQALLSIDELINRLTGSVSQAWYMYRVPHNPCHINCSNLCDLIGQVIWGTLQIYDNTLISFLSLFFGICKYLCYYVCMYVSMSIYLYLFKLLYDKMSVTSAGQYIHYPIIVFFWPKRLIIIVLDRSDNIPHLLALKVKS